MSEREDAQPEWEDFDTTARAEHREHCVDACPTCDGHRAWGVCTTCGTNTERLDQGESRCCGSVVALTGPEADDLRGRAA